MCGSDRFAIGAYTNTPGKTCFRRRFPFLSYCAIECFRLVLSAFRVPSKMIASPYLPTMLWMYSFVGFIFIRSVHQRKNRFGEGYPLPMRLTQNESASVGVTF